METDTLTSGTRVILHSLSKAELNGAHGFLHDYVAHSGRWAVVLDEAQLRPRGGPVPAHHRHTAPQHDDTRQHNTIEQHKRHNALAALLRQTPGSRTHT